MASRPARMSGVSTDAHEVPPRVARYDALERKGPAFCLDHQHTARAVPLARSVNGAAVPQLSRASRAVTFREPNPSESHLHDKASRAMSFLTSSVPHFTQPTRQSVPRNVGLFPHQQSVQRSAGHHLITLASRAVLIPFPSRQSVPRDVVIQLPHHTSVQRSVGLRTRKVHNKRLSFYRRDDFTQQCRPGRLSTRRTSRCPHRC